MNSSSNIQELNNHRIQSIKDMIFAFSEAALFKEIQIQDKQVEKFMRRNLLRQILIFEFNKGQIHLLVYLIDIFISLKKEFAQSYRNIKNILDASISTTHKLTEDICYTDKVIVKALNNPILSKIENMLYKELDFEFDMNNPIRVLYARDFLDLYDL